MDYPAAAATKPDKAQEQSIPEARKINPDKSEPAATAELIKKLAKSKLHHDQAAGELAPIFGLGDDLLAKTRTQCLFSHAVLNEIFHEFDDKFLNGDWGLPIAKWQRVSQLAMEHILDADWTKTSYPDFDVYGNWDVNDHYARFMTRVMAEIETPSQQSFLLFWVREADIENGFWILFHTLMYLHLKKMHENQRHAPLKARLLRRLSIVRN